MKRIAVSAALAAAVFSAGFAIAAVKPGENLLLNGRLEADQVDFPPFWKSNSLSKEYLKWYPGGGPDGLPYISVLGTTKESGTPRAIGCCGSTTQTRSFSPSSRQRREQDVPVRRRKIFA